MVKTRSSSLGVLALGALGVVYGDIGTSPLYAVRECFDAHKGLALTEDHIYGVLSMIFWSFMIVISLKYMFLILRADNRGEGGILALMALTNTKPGRLTKRFNVFFLVGDFWSGSSFWGRNDHSGHFCFECS
jgi:KUP system potassium uptake protein